MSVLQNAYFNIFFLFWLACAPLEISSENFSTLTDYQDSLIEGLSDLEQSLVEKASLKRCKREKLSYYLYVSDFVQSFIEVPTSNVTSDTTTIASSYLAGRAPVYNELNEVVGNCSASFLNIQNAQGIYTDISNYLSVDNGLVITWFTPTTLINLELDSLVHSMVTECIVLANTKVGFNPYYGKTFNMIVSSDNGKIYFKLTRIYR